MCGPRNQNTSSITNADAQVRLQTNNLLAIEAQLRLELDAGDLADRLAAVRAELLRRSERELAVTR